MVRIGFVDLRLPGHFGLGGNFLVAQGDDALSLRQWQDNYVNHLSLWSKNWIMCWYWCWILRYVPLLWCCWLLVRNFAIIITNNTYLIYSYLVLFSGVMAFRHISTKFSRALRTFLYGGVLYILCTQGKMSSNFLFNISLSCLTKFLSAVFYLLTYKK